MGGGGIAGDRYWKFAGVLLRMEMNCYQGIVGWRVHHASELWFLV